MEQRSGTVGAVLGGLALLGVVLVGGGLGYAWTHPQVPEQTAQDAERLQALDGQVQAAKQQRDALAAQLDGLKSRLADVEGRKAPDLAPLDQRLSTLEKSAAGTGAQDFTEMSRRIDALATREDQLGSRQQAEVDTVNGRNDAAITQSRAEGAAALAALSHQIGAAQDADKAARDALAASLGGRIDATAASLSGKSDAAVAALSGRVDKAGADLSGRMDAAAAADKAARDTLAGDLGGRIDAMTAALGHRIDETGAADKAGLAALGGQLAGVEGRLGTVEQSSGKVAGLAARAGQMAQLQSAQVNLAAGRKLGPLPDAPPALAKYASTAPPTEAGLKLAFTDAAEAARQASEPQSAARPFLGRVWARVQQTVVVRQGDSVIVGDPASGVLARAQDALDAGDLGGTVQIVEGLQGPAKDAMADWLAQAHALLDARAALAQLVAHA